MLHKRKILLSLLILFFLSYNHFAQTFSPQFEFGPDMTVARMGHYTVPLENQSILLIGGHGTSFTSLSNSELFTSNPDSFVYQAMNFPHDFGAVAEMQDGRILIAGGAMDWGVAPGYSSAEIYDPVTASYTVTGSLIYARMMTSAATLNNGKILVAGGWYDNNSGTYPELYDAQNGTFSLTSALNTPRSQPVVIPTNDGGAMIIGGSPVYGGADIKQVEYYNPTTNTFSVLSEYLFDSNDPDWVPLGYSYYNRPVRTQLTNDGKYILIAYKYVSGNYYFTLFSVDPELKTISKLNSQTEFPDYSTHWLFAPIVDKNKNVVYIPATRTGSNPLQIDLIAFDMVDSTILIPDTPFTLPSAYYLTSAGYNLLDDGRILISGGHSEAGYYTNFTPINKTLFVTPNFTPTNIETEVEPIDDYKLNLTNYPNPFNNSTTFRFELNKTEAVELDIINIQGEVVAKLFKKDLAAGIYNYRWISNSLASGIYFSRLKTSSGVQFRKIILLK